MPRWGRGRVDTFNPYKAIQFNWNLDRLPASELMGASDFPSLWNQKPREGMHLHWDGDNDSVDERNLSAGLGAGITPVTVDHAGLKRVRDWIWTLPPPAYPYPVDAALAARGATVYQQHCRQLPWRPPVPRRRHRRRSHRPGRRHRSRSGRTAHRLDSYTATFALNQYGLFPDSPYRFTRFRKTHGYANQPLDGIWLRGPVPPQRLGADAARSAEPAGSSARPCSIAATTCSTPSAWASSRTSPESSGRRFTRYDTTVPGNGNSGHEYGTTLSDADKAAIVEYLKTF